MLIEIPDDITPQERRKILDIVPIACALIMHNKAVAPSAEYLDMSIEDFYSKVKEYEELQCFIKKGALTQIIQQAERALQIRLDKNPLAKICRAHIRQTEKSLGFRQKPINEQQKIVARIKSLYGVRY